jgi:hypothetical protein
MKFALSSGLKLFTDKGRYNFCVLLTCPSFCSSLRALPGSLDKVSKFLQCPHASRPHQLPRDPVGLFQRTFEEKYRTALSRESCGDCSSKNARAYNDNTDLVVIGTAIGSVHGVFGSDIGVTGRVLMVGGR